MSTLNAAVQGGHGRQLTQKSDSHLPVPLPGFPGLAASLPSCPGQQAQRAQQPRPYAQKATQKKPKYPDHHQRHLQLPDTPPLQVASLLKEEAQHQPLAETWQCLLFVQFGGNLTAPIQRAMKPRVCQRSCIILGDSTSYSARAVCRSAGHSTTHATTSFTSAYSSAPNNATVCTVPAKLQPCSIEEI